MKFQDILSIFYDNWTIKGNVLECQKFDNGSPNDVWKIKCSEGCYVLKKCKLDVENDWYKIQHLYLEKWKSEGIPVSMPILTKNNNNVANVSGELYQLYGFVEGERYQLNKINMLRQVALLTTELHSVECDDSDQKSAFNDLELWLQYPKENLENLKITLLNLETSNLDINEYLKEVEDNLYFAQASLSYETYMSLPRALTHGELHHTNIIFKDNKLKCLIDFDSIQVRPRIYDIARASLFLSRKRRGEFVVNEKFVYEFLQIYCKNSKLTKEEFNGISIILLYYFMPTASYVKKMAKSEKLSWYLPWTLKGMRYVKNEFTSIVENNLRRVLLK